MNKSEILKAIEWVDLAAREGDGRGLAKAKQALEEELSSKYTAGSPEIAYRTALRVSCVSMVVNLWKRWPRRRISTRQPKTARNLLRILDAWSWGCRTSAGRWQASDVNTGSLPRPGSDGREPRALSPSFLAHRTSPQQRSATLPSQVGISPMGGPCLLSYALTSSG